MAHTPRVKLSIGASGPVKTLTFVIALIMLSISAYIALIAFGLAYGARTTVTSSLNDGQYHIDENGNLVPGPGDAEPASRVELTGGIVGAVCALLVIAVAAYLVLRVFRSSAWLEGSVLHVRGALGTRQQDLATAMVSGGPHLITAKDPGTGKTLTLPLRSGQAMLPAEELRMLANAITNSRTRRGEDDTAFLMAEHLRKVSSDPFS